jgi:hypothetical protein
MKLLKKLLATLAIAAVVLVTSCSSDDGITANQADVNLAEAGINETFPANLADTVAVNPLIVVNFKSTANPSEVAASVLTLQKGTEAIPGTVTFSGTKAVFKPETYLSPDSKFTATIKTNLKDGSSNDNEKEHSWTFRTGNHQHQKAFSVVSVTPMNSETDVAFDIQPTITFSREMESKRTELVTFTLNQGTTVVEGALTYSDITATFIPTNSLVANTLYTGTITINTNKNGGDEDDDDDHYYDENDNDDSDDNHDSDDNDEGDHNQSTHTYIWSFTTEGDGVAVDTTAPTVLSVNPADNAASIAVNSNVTADFSEIMDAATISAATFTLKQGTTNVDGSVSYSGTTATFNPVNDLDGGLAYTATMTTEAKDVAGNAMAASKVWSFTTLVPVAIDLTAPTVLSVVPLNNAASIAVNNNVTATFSEAMDAATISTTTFTLKQGTTNVAGSVSYSGSTATFNPTNDLDGGLAYTATMTTGAKDVAGNAMAASKVWSFTTLVPVAGDTTAPTVLSVLPANNANSIAVNSNVTATFSEAMDAATISTTTFTLKQGTTNVAGSVSYSGSTATFNPANDLDGGLAYTATMTTGAKDVSGNAMAASKVWSFTTLVPVVADTTAPTVLSVVPVNNAASIAVNSNVTAAFSEAMDAATISTTTFTLKQGTTNVAGSVSYSGTTATFNPTSDLVGSTVYTATMTTGAKDVAGNAIAAAKTWSFTTVTVVAAVSWATDVQPIINNRCTMCHGSSGGSGGINLGTYEQVSSLSDSQLDNSGMFSKGGVTTVEQEIIRAWIADGKLNN